MYVYTHMAARTRERRGRPVQAGEPVIFGSSTLRRGNNLSKVWESQGYIKWEGKKMNKVCIVFETGNSCFDDDRRGEVAKVLSRLSETLLNDDKNKISILDSNGNQIGVMTL